MSPADRSASAGDSGLGRLTFPDPGAAGVEVTHMPPAGRLPFHPEVDRVV